MLLGQSLVDLSPLRHFKKIRNAAGHPRVTILCVRIDQKAYWHT